MPVSNGARLSRSHLSMLCRFGCIDHQPSTRTNQFSSLFSVEHLGNKIRKLIFHFTMRKCVIDVKFLLLIKHIQPRALYQDRKQKYGIFCQIWFLGIKSIIYQNPCATYIHSYESPTWKCQPLWLGQYQVTMGNTLKLSLYDIFLI